MIGPTILVVGGGRSALEAAKEIVAQRGRAVLVRPVAKRACHLRTPSGIETLDSAELMGLDGSPGRFTAHLRVEDELVIVNCGAVILADEAPSSNEGAPGAMGLDEALAGSLPEHAKSMAIVLGASAPRAAYRRSVELALQSISRSDRPKVTLFVKDMKIYGRDEIAYAEAQRQGVRVVWSEHTPVLAYGGRTSVKAIDSPSGIEINCEPDLLVVELGLPGPLSSSIGRAAGVLGSGRGNISMGAASSLREGVFLCGPDASELLDDELMIGARAAATRAMSAALHPVIRAPQAATVDRDKCSACLTCVRCCPFHAPRIDDEGKAAIEGELCQACGICVAACPSRALSLPSDQGMDNVLTSLFKEASP